MVKCVSLWQKFNIFFQCQNSMKNVLTSDIPVQKLAVYQWFSLVSSPFLLFLTELVGFEPTNSGVKVPCLTAWRQPIVSLFSYKYHSINVIFANLLKSALENDKVKYLMHCPGLEPGTSRLSGGRSHLLS